MQFYLEQTLCKYYSTLPHIQAKPYVNIYQVTPSLSRAREKLSLDVNIFSTNTIKATLSEIESLNS